MMWGGRVASESSCFVTMMPTSSENASFIGVSFLREWSLMGVQLFPTVIVR